jgi:hypothetical protein
MFLASLKRWTRSRRRGAALGLVAALALALIIIGAAIFTIIMIMGGSKEMRNAVDAGALNVGKSALTVTVPDPNGANGQFDDVSDSNHKFGLPNINRVWAKAYLIAANYNAMETEGTTGSSFNNVQQVQTNAQQISDALYQALQPQTTTFFNFFKAIADTSSLRMLGQSSTVQEVNDSKWSIACMDRGADSNVYIQPQQFPSDYNLPPTATVPSSDGKQCLIGYEPVSVDQWNFWFVPFRWNEKPHLVSEDHFEENNLTNDPVTYKSPPPPATGTVTWTKPVPNSFSVHGKTIKQHEFGEEAVSWVTTNPQTRYPMSIPHGFIKIKIDQNKAEYQTLMMPVPLEDDYGFTPIEQSEPALPVPGCGVGTVVAMMGDEYIPPTINQAVFASLSDSYTQVKAWLVQRINEIHPGFTDANLTSLLSTGYIPTGDSLNFVIYNDDSNTVQVTTLDNASSIPWLAAVVNQDPDGSAAPTYSESFIPYEPNIVEDWSLEGTFCTEGPLYYLTESGTMTWTPGSGFNGNLGSLEIQRETDVYLAGICVCP